jgi:pantoate--beta-alanine ligase
MSSRNAYLSAEERGRALAIVRSLAAASRRFAEGDRDPRALEGAARAVLEPSVTFIDYVAVRDAESLAELPVVRDRAVLAVACRVGTTRLIDNTVLGEDPPPPGGPGTP